MGKPRRPEAAGTLDLKGVVRDVTFDRFSYERWSRASTHVPSEMALAISVNRQELVTILCTPTKLNCLVLGFLYAEGIISGLGDVASLRVCEEESLADVRLTDPAVKLPRQRTLTSGCGAGATFKTRGQRIDSDLMATPKEILWLMDRLQKQMVLYRLGGGVHASALCDTKNLLVVAEDIGRHNTLDKIQGECLLRTLATGDRLLLSTGRVSSEMLLRASKMRVPIVVSRHSSTGSAVSLARDLGIALVSRARGGGLSVFSHPERLGCSRIQASETG